MPEKRKRKSNGWVNLVNEENCAATGQEDASEFKLLKPRELFFSDASYETYKKSYEEQANKLRKDEKDFVIKGWQYLDKYRDALGTNFYHESTKYTKSEHDGHTRKGKGYGPLVDEKALEKKGVIKQLAFQVGYYRKCITTNTEAKRDDYKVGVVKGKDAASKGRCLPIDIQKYINKEQKDENLYFEGFKDGYKEKRSEMSLEKVKQKSEEYKEKALQYKKRLRKEEIARSQRQDSNFRKDTDALSSISHIEKVIKIISKKHYYNNFYYFHDKKLIEIFNLNDKPYYITYLLKAIIENNESDFNKHLEPISSKLPCLISESIIFYQDDIDIYSTSFDYETIALMFACYYARINFIKQLIEEHTDFNKYTNFVLNGVGTAQQKKEIITLFFPQRPEVSIDEIFTSNDFKLKPILTSSLIYPEVPRLREKLAEEGGFTYLKSEQPEDVVTVVKLAVFEGKEYGLIARREIKPGESFLEYTGLIIDIKSAEKSQFAAALDGNRVKDAAIIGNSARTINDSKYPNAKLETTDDDRVWVTALGPIAEGAQILIEYGSNFPIEKPLGLNPSDTHISNAQKFEDNKKFYYNKIYSLSQQVIEAFNLKNTHGFRITYLMKAIIENDQIKFETYLEKYTLELPCLAIQESAANNTVSDKFYEAHECNYTNALMFACYYGRSEMVKLLLQKGAYSYAQQTFTLHTCVDFILLGLGSEQQKFEILNLFISLNIKLNVTNKAAKDCLAALNDSRMNSYLDDAGKPLFFLSKTQDNEDIERLKSFLGYTLTPSSEISFCIAPTAVPKIDETNIGNFDKDQLRFSLFVMQSIQKGSMVCAIKGEKIKAENCKDLDISFLYTTDDPSIMLYNKRRGSEARLVQGVPKAIQANVRIDKIDGKVCYVAKRVILPGEQIVAKFTDNSLAELPTTLEKVANQYNKTQNQYTVLLNTNTDRWAIDFEKRPIYSSTDLQDVEGIPAKLENKNAQSIDIWTEIAFWVNPNSDSRLPDLIQHMPVNEFTKLCKHVNDDGETLLIFAVKNSLPLLKMLLSKIKEPDLTEILNEANERMRKYLEYSCANEKPAVLSYKWKKQDKLVLLDVLKTLGIVQFKEVKNIFNHFFSQNVLLNKTLHIAEEHYEQLSANNFTDRAMNY